MEIRTYFVPVFHTFSYNELPQSLGCLWPDNLSHADLTTPGARPDNSKASILFDILGMFRN